MKPFLAHLFKYTLSSQFPMKADDLNYFCQKIMSYNDKMESENSNMRALPCYNSTVFNQKIPGGVFSYLLFEKPLSGFKLSEICVPHCAKERVCKYMMKDFAKGWLDSIIYSQKSDDKLDVNFLLAQNGLFYGKVPVVRSSLNKTSASFRSLMTEAGKKKIPSATPKADPNKYLITLAYPKAFSPDGLQNKPTVDPKIKEIKNKQLMVSFGNFLINMYKGLDNSTDVPPTNPEDNFNPVGLNYLNYTDVYLNLNTDKNGNYSQFRSDEYFGVKTQYVSALREFLDHTLVSQQAFKEMDELLKGSFYEFIFKSVNFDLQNVKQFDSLDTMLKHKFIVSKFGINLLRSDTSFEK